MLKGFCVSEGIISMVKIVFRIQNFVILCYFLLPFFLQNNTVNVLSKVYHCLFQYVILFFS